MIYFIQSDNNGPIKIGYTATNINQRFQQLKTGNPCTLTLLCVIDGNEQDEKNLHEKLKSHRINGEWFSPHWSILNYISMLTPMEYPDLNKTISFDLKQEMIAIENRYIKKALDICNGNRSRAAKLLNLTRPTFHSKLIRWLNIAD